MVLLLLITVCERAAAKESAPLESVHRDPRVSPAVLLHGKGQGTWLGLGPIVHHPGAVSPRISDAMLMNLYFSGGCQSFNLLFRNLRATRAPEAARSAGIWWQNTPQKHGLDKKGLEQILPPGSRLHL